jgi:hypothetical protein
MLILTAFRRGTARRFAQDWLRTIGEVATKNTLRGWLLTTVGLPPDEGLHKPGRYAIDMHVVRYRDSADGCLGQEQ